MSLQQLGQWRIATTIIAPEPDFAYRDISVREPFGYTDAVRHPLTRIAHDAGAELRGGQLTRVDTSAQTISTEAGEVMPCDALLLAVGACVHARLEHATTLDDKHIDDQLHGLVQDVEGGYVTRLVVIVSGPTSWPLPAYELALMTASRAFDMAIEMSITIITEEEAPLTIFGSKVSAAMAQHLEQRRIQTITATRCEIPAAGRIDVGPMASELLADRIVAIPELMGPGLPAVPDSSPGGFIPVDRFGPVVGAGPVYAAGDATIKLGGIAGQQADVAAQSIAADFALAPPPLPLPLPLHPKLYTMLLTRGAHRYLSADASDDPSALPFDAGWRPLEQLVGERLGPYLRAQPSWSSHAVFA